MRVHIRALALLALLLVPVRPALAAAGPVLRGLVTDTAGRPIPNVQVVVTALNRATSTGSDGRFAFVALPAGSYHLSTLCIGYAPAHADVVIPASGPDVQVTLVLHQTALQLSGVQVTATPIGTDPRGVPQSTLSLSGQELSRNLGGTIAQTLAEEPGVSVRFSGPAATAPVIRGLQGERVLVLEDGNRAADLSSAAPDHGTSIDPLNAQRIEVVRGPASLLYGNQALGGVVNVISNDIPTAIPTHVEGTAAFNSESANPGAAATVGLTIPVTDRIAVVAKGGVRHTNDLRMGGGGTLSNTFYRNYSGVAGLGYNSGATSMGLAYREYQFQYGLPSNEGERSKIDGHRHELTGRADLALNHGFFSSVRLGGTAQWYGHAEVSQETGDVDTRFDLRTQTVDVLARTQAGMFSGAIGVSGLFKQYAALGDEALTPAANSNGVGAFVFQELPLRDTKGDADALVPKFQIGGRYDAYRIDIKQSDAPKFSAFAGARTFGEFSGSVGVSVPLTSSVTFSTSVARAFRAPSVEELSSNAFHTAQGTYDVGNPNLKAEVNQGVEGVLRLEHKRVNGQFAAFYNSIQNYVTPNIVKDTIAMIDGSPATVPLNRISQANARLRGLEGQIEGEIAPHVVLGAMGDLVRGALAANDEPLPFMPAARLGGHVRWDDGRMSAEAGYRHAFAQNRVPPAISDEDPSGIATPAYDLLNLSVGWTLRTGDRVNSITLRVDNALDEKYVDATSRLKTFAFNPGRNFALVYRVLF